MNETSFFQTTNLQIIQNGSLGLVDNALLLLLFLLSRGLGFGAAGRNRRQRAFHGPRRRHLVKERRNVGRDFRLTLAPRLGTNTGSKTLEVHSFFFSFFQGRPSFFCFGMSATNRTGLGRHIHLSHFCASPVSGSIHPGCSLLKTSSRESIPQTVGAFRSKRHCIHSDCELRSLVCWAGCLRNPPDKLSDG